MFDNFLEEEYHPSDPVFTHPRSQKQLYIGDIQSALDCDNLKQKQISTVVTAAKDMDHVQYDSTILHITYPLLDGKHEDIAAFFDAFYILVQNNIDKGNILIHCAAGISRSSTLVISYIMKFKKVGFREAIAEVRKYRPAVLPNLGFERQLKKYQESVKVSAKNDRVIRRNQEKKIGSGHHILMKTQIIPNFDCLNPPKNDKLMSNHFFDKPVSKDSNILRIYNNPQRNEIKQKKFVITKKAASFSRQPQRKDLMIDMIRQKEQQSSRRGQRTVNSSLQEMKAIYLLRKGQFDRHNTTERSGTFYNMRANKVEI